MPLSMYQLSVPVFLRGLGVLATLLEKGEAFARETSTDPATLIGARLAPDMFPLSAQVQRCSDTSKLAVERLTGIKSPRFEDVETSFPELQERIAKTVAFLNSFEPAQFEGSEERQVQLSFGEFKPVFRGADYLLTFALPNFFFHVTTAYDILRHKGVQVGKHDYLGPYG